MGASQGPPNAQQRRGSGASAAEVRATEKVAAAQAAVNRSFAGSLFKMAAAGGAAYLVYYMWKHSEEPLPEPVSDALSKAASIGGAVDQQRLEEMKGTYPGAGSDVPSKDRQEAAKKR